MALETIICLFLIGIFTAGCIDLLFNPISIIHKNFWQRVQKLIFKLGKNSNDFPPYILVTCPYCFALWISFFSCFILFPDLDLIRYILYTIVSWYLANTFRLITDILIKIKVFAFSSIEE